MVVHDCGEYTPVTTDQNSFQLVMKLGVVSWVDAAVVEAALPAAWAAGCAVALSWDRWAAVLEPDCAALWATAADCSGPADSLVVRGGSVNGVSWAALAEDAA
ncbi:hypothetical protein P863_12685 [Mycobacterium avium subsp. silvaticum ATCC 49884]|nr:hypothetical protein P863_12685 [Mycobacterium avium subsp. silvaticum ATCC 49884]